MLPDIGKVPRPAADTSVLPVKSKNNAFASDVPAVVIFAVLSALVTFLGD
jgi:hypothetical protein